MKEKFEGEGITEIVKKKEKNEDNSFPEKLDKDKIGKIVKRFESQGLRADQDIEHFVIEKNEKKFFIIKKEFVLVKNSRGEISRVKIEDFIEKRIREINAEDSEETN